MSRIDQALKMWEAAAGGPKATDSARTRPNNGSALNQYPAEGSIGVESVATSQLASSPEPVEPPPDVSPLVSRRIATLSDNVDRQARLVSGTSSTASLEQYRRLAAILLEEQATKQLKTLMVTSAVPKEGKTLTVVNLALTLTESYARRVLIVDADLRCPGVHSVLNIPNDHGLSEALRDGPDEIPIIDVSSRLSVLTAGAAGAAPLARLTSKHMEKVIEECARRFDWVLVDTSPVGVLPDAQVLARLVGAVILVIGAGATPAAAVERAVAELGPDSIIGTVLNRVDERLIPQADYYGHYAAPRYEI